MPIAKIQLADGRIARFEVPEGTTQEQVLQFAQQNMERLQGQTTPEAEAPQGRTRDEITRDLAVEQPQGNVERIKQLNEELAQQQANEKESKLSQFTPEQRELAESIGPLEAAAIGAGRGLTNIGRAIGLAEPESESERQAIQSLKAESPISTGAGEILGEAAPFLPAGLAAGAIKSAIPRALAIGATGAAETGLIARGEGRDVGEQLKAAGIGGTLASALDVGIPVIGRIGGKIIRKLTGKAPKGAVLDAAGRPSKEFVDALAASGQSIDDVVNQAKKELTDQAVDPSEAARKAFFESQGLKPTRAQITRNAADFQAQQEAAKTSGRVEQALKDQDAILTSRFDNAILDASSKSNSEAVSVFDAITEKATKLDQNISDLYKVARNNLSDEKVVRFETLAKTLRKVAPDNEATGGAVNSIVGDLKNRGILDKNMKVVGRVDVGTAEEIRKLSNELYDPSKPFRNARLRQIKEALDDDVFKASGDDVFKQARQSKADFERDLSRAKVSKFDSRRDNLVRDVLENKIDPDQMVDKVVLSKRWRPDDLQQLKDYITTNDAGKQAFDDLRSETLESIKEKAFIGAADDAGNRTLSRDKLQKTLQKIGSKKLDVLFTKPEQKFLKDMLEVAKLREPVRGTAIGRGPSAQAISRLEKRISDLPIMGGLIDLLDIDRQGRALIKAKPKSLKTPISSSPARAALALPLAATTAAAQEEE